MPDIERGPKIEITDTSLAVVNAHNSLVDAKKAGGKAHADAVRQLVDVLANGKGAVEVYSAIQNKT